MSADLLAEFEEFAKPTSSTPTRVPHQVKSTQASSLGSQPLAAFADPATARTHGQSGQLSQATPAPQQHTHADPWGALSELTSPGTTLNTVEEDDDGWGDFEVAQPISQPPAQAPLAPTAPTPTAPTAFPVPKTQSPAFKQPPALSRTRIVRAPTIELMTNSLLDVDGANKLPEDTRTPSWMRTQFENKAIKPPQAARPGKPKKVSDILFDADDFDSQSNGFDDDEFGDFESVPSPARAPANLTSDELFPSGSIAKPSTRPPSNLSLKEPLSPYPQAPKSPSFHDRNPFPGLAVATPIEPRKVQDETPKTSPITAWPTIGQGGSAASNTMDDDWGAFGDLPEDSAVTASPMKSKTENDSWDWDAFDGSKPTVAQPRKTQAPAAEIPDSTWDWNPINQASEPTQTSDDKAAPPINIPPPALLLSIFPQLLGQANTVLYKPIGGQPFSAKNRILSDPKTIEYLRGYVSLATVAARIVAGRKHRWHRDKFLAQGMSISAAGSKGMKLAGVDKTQAAREDREAADILDTWKENVGRLRSSIATANAATKNTSAHLKIPELRENMLVQAAKGVPTAPKACVICGLKREERISRVDFDVEDSFGEFWTDHWGHTACKRFWLQHERVLRQR